MRAILITCLSCLVSLSLFGQKTSLSAFLDTMRADNYRDNELGDWVYFSNLMPQWLSITCTLKGP